MPEQYQLSGLVQGLRWITNGDYAGPRLAAHGPLSERSATWCTTWMAVPSKRPSTSSWALGRTHCGKTDAFPSLGRHCKWWGCACCSGTTAPHALISAEVVPFRPHRGIVLIVEEARRRPLRTSGCNGCTPSTIRRCSRRPAPPAPGHSVRATGWSRLPGGGAPTTNTSPSSTSTPTRSPPAPPGPADRIPVALRRRATGVRRAAADRDELGCLAGRGHLRGWQRRHQLRWRSSTAANDGREVTVFSRRCGTPGAPALVLVHGFPTSSIDYFA